jgi:hypothetical protein
MCSESTDNESKFSEPTAIYPKASPDSGRAKQPVLPEPPYKPYDEKPELHEPPYKPYAEEPGLHEPPYKPYQGL